MTRAGLVCGSCGTELSEKAKSCSQSGAPIPTATTPAEYKQVIILFADVVHSMDLAATVGSERLREIMAVLFGSTHGVALLVRTRSVGATYWCALAMTTTLAVCRSCPLTRCGRRR
jgi:hypothetical protein